ncbi:MAG: anthranilate synthase component I family protein [Sedimentisphaerales bacterium]|nr:anthranilate synthase component I family protein [Sedimentisphaerales bacterium]
MPTGALNTHDGCVTCRCCCKELHATAGLGAVSEVFAALKSPSILGGNSAVAGGEGFSYWAAEPREVFEFASEQQAPFDKLRERLGRYRIAEELPCQVPKGLLRGGWIGYIAYELGRYIERLPQTTVDDLALPLIRLCFYDRLLAYDHRRGMFWAVALSLPDDAEPLEEKIIGLERLLDAARGCDPPQPRAADIERVDLAKAVGNMTHKDYLSAVERTKRYIRDGDIYQVNLSQRFERPFAGRPIDLFAWQNRFNPSPYPAYIDLGDRQIVSASPEMFITIRDGRILTKPIKGTRPRLDPFDHASEAMNASNFEELRTNEKERAELNMIVDLERNDIARICIPGTRRVVQPRTIETYPTVFHAVATVAGRLRPEIDFTEALKAVFPGGSITGAPKIRAMEIIDELEPTARGVYTGSIGYIGLDGTACLNIAIRTIIIASGKAFVQSGGGIVADSSPEAEWEETLTKVRALLAGIEAVQSR